MALGMDMRVVVIGPKDKISNLSEGNRDIECRTRQMPVNEQTTFTIEGPTFPRPTKYEFKFGRRGGERYSAK
jgi:hypothetical protein